ncbi:MAG: ABC transporter ATP-binding protein [Pseudomonadota bacterium]
MSDINVNVSHSYGAHEVFQGLNFQIQPNEFVCILGKSGCGKSTLAKILAGLMKPSDGAVQIGSEPIDLSRHELAFVFQEPALWPWRNVTENVRTGMEIKKRPKAQMDERAKKLIDLVGLNGFEKHYPHQLSGGMKQRASIARAFAVDADLILMDEPFAALDAQTREFMQKEVLRIWEQHKHTVVFITHGIEEAILLAERIIVLGANPGRIIADFKVDLKRPRNFADPGFIEIRQKISGLIGGSH